MLKVVVIGESGHIGYVSRASGINRLFVVSAVSDGPELRGCEKAYAAFAGINRDTRKYQSYTEMLDSERPDIAVVNPYYGYNASVNMECIKRGIHIFSEKPIATNMFDLDRMKEMYCLQQDVKLSAMMGIRYTPWFTAAKTAVSDGRIGEVRLINAQKSYKLGKRDGFFSERGLYGGTIPWVGSHAIDWVGWLSGAKFLEVYATHSSVGNINNNSFEMTALCVFKMENEISASVSIDYLRPSGASTHGDDRVRVVGTKGIVEVIGDKAVLIDAAGEQVLDMEKQTGVFDEFISSLLGLPNRCVTAEEAFSVTEACLLARESADTGKPMYFMVKGKL